VTILIHKLKSGHCPDKFRPTLEVPSSPIRRPKTSEVSPRLLKITRSKYCLPQSLLLCQELIKLLTTLPNLFWAFLQLMYSSIHCSAHNTHTHTNAETKSCLRNHPANIWYIFINRNWVVTRWQYTFAHKQYIEQHKHKLMWKSAGRVQFLRVLPWPYNWGKCKEKPQSG
jgi:hypothetical protein